METVVCRLLPYETTSGADNMAADETMLDSAATGTASLRFYEWQEPTLSLGYFQPEATRLADERIRSLPYVRRLTGGNTLIHHHELTYALALPAGAPWQPRRDTVTSWLCRMHRVIAAAFAESGVHVTVSEQSTRSDHDFLCFKHVTPGDVLIGTEKVVGSAQRRQRGALLQHGGILLKRSDYTPNLPGIAELTGRILNARELAKAIEQAWTRQTGFTLTPGAWTDQERQRRHELVRLKYTRATWNEKR